MPGWLIDLFGSRQLNQIFWWLTIAPLPVWVGLVLWPENRWVRRLASPFFAPPLLGVVYLLLVWKLREIGLPHPPADADTRSMRAFLTHPIVFLVLWAHLQMANLFVGAVLRDDAHRRRLAIPIELALCWLFAPAAVVLYSIRRLLRRRWPTER